MSTREAPAWSDLDAAAKHDRVLEVANELFARDGIETPMPALAEALGVGVGSIYRQVGRKEDIVAALVVGRLREHSARIEASAAIPDAWDALCSVTYACVEDAVCDGLAREMFALTSSHPAVVAARPRATRALEAMVDRARAQGALREDASVDDLRLVFQTAKQVDVGAGGARRLAELALRGLRA